MLSATVFGRTSSFHLMLFSANSAQGIIESAQITYTISEGKSLGTPR